MPHATFEPSIQAPHPRVQGRLNGAFRLLGPTGVHRLTGYFGAPAELPARQAAELKAFLDSNQVAEINAAEFAATPATDDQLRAVASLGNRLRFVLSAIEHGQSKQQERQWQIWQRDLTSLSDDQRSDPASRGGGARPTTLDVRRGSFAGGSIDLMVGPSST